MPSDADLQVVSAIAVDPSGARIATGSHDYDTKLWDFGGMDARLKPFKSFEANGNYHVRSELPFDSLPAD
jgi:WD40 repeat protein